MIVERKIQGIGRSLRNPFGGGAWVPVEILEGETPSIEIQDSRGGRRVILSRRPGGEVLAKLETPKGQGEYWLTQDEEINSRRAPWAGRLRYRRG